MKRTITLKKGDTLYVKLPELMQYNPSLREMVLTLVMRSDGTIGINTVYMNSTVTAEQGITGHTLTFHHHND